MANEEHLTLLQRGVDVWDAWREQHPTIVPDLSRAVLTEADLLGANLRSANLFGAECSRARFGPADLTGADLRESVCVGADFSRATLCRAKLGDATLVSANFGGADLTEADLSRADLTGAILIMAKLGGAVLRDAKLYWANLAEARFTDADMNGCAVYGVSVWNVDLAGAKQQRLVVSRPEEPAITVDNLEMAQFVYLMLNNRRIRQVIDTITSKVVLILGRFTPDRKQVLDALRDELRRRDYLPVVFDFERPANRDITETVSTLAHMSRFVIADITEARSIPQELMAIVPDLPSVPVQPLLRAGSEEYPMFEHFRRFPWVLDVFEYQDTASVIASLQDKVIGPAEAEAKKLSRR